MNVLAFSVQASMLNSNTCILEIPKVNGVIYMPECIHVPPDDVLTQNYGVIFLKLLHTMDHLCNMLLNRVNYPVCQQFIQCFVRNPR